MNRAAIKEAAFQRVAERMVRQLSDSLGNRKTELEDLLLILPSDHPAVPKVRALLHPLNLHDLAQMEFPLGNPEGDPTK